jgi:predicted dehydrogenase
MTRKVRIAVVGFGGFTREVHLPNLQADGRYQVRAIVDPNPDIAEETALKEGTAYFTRDYHQVLQDSEVEAVFIITPHYLHAQLAVDAAQAGKHIFCEKPMGLSEEECLAVASAVQRAGVKYTAGYNRSVAPLTLEAHKILTDLDAPVMIMHRMADWFPYSQKWLLDGKLSGGRVIGEAGHALDMICQLIGQEPVRVYAEGGNLVGQGSPDVPDSAMITLGFPNGSTGSLFLSSIANNGYPKEEVLITCLNHTILIKNFESMVIYSVQGRQEITLPKMNKGQPELVGLFAQAIIDNTPAPNGLDTTLRTSRCTFAAVKSILTHQVQYL